MNCSPSLLPRFSSLGARAGGMGGASRVGDAPLHSPQSCGRALISHTARKRGVLLGPGEVSMSGSGHPR